MFAAYLMFAVLRNILRVCHQAFFIQMFCFSGVNLLGKQILPFRLTVRQVIFKGKTKLGTN